jgi:cytochrome c oxidase assembly factor 6
MPQDLLTKEGRQACWDAKDNFWKCMDVNNGEESKCQPQREIFEKDCSKAWVIDKYI